MSTTVKHIESANKSYSVKVNLGTDIRRFTLSRLCFADLDGLVRSAFHLPMDMPIDMKYLDDQKDWISLSSDDELKFAAGIGEMIRLEISPKNQQGEIDSAPVPAAPPTTSPVAPAVGITDTNQDKKKAKKPWKVDKEKIKQERKQLREQFKNGLRVVSESIEPAQDKFQPGQAFVKKWKLKNESTVAWKDFVLAFKRGTNMAQQDEFPLGKEVQPGEEVDISIPMTAPDSCGTFLCVWRLLGSVGPAGRRFFGGPLKFKLAVADNTNTKPQEELANASKPKVDLNFEAQMEQLRKMGFLNDCLNKRVLKKANGDVEKAICMLNRRKKRCQAAQSSA